MKKKEDGLGQARVEGKKYDSSGKHMISIKNDMELLLAREAGNTLAQAREHLCDYDYRLLCAAREIRSRLALAVSNPKDLSNTRKELVEQLQKPAEEGGYGYCQSAAYRLIKAILSSMAGAEELDRKTHRMVLDRRNQRAWEIAEEQKDVAAMNAADKNYIAIHQLEQEDVEKLDADKIQVQNLMVTVNYNTVVPDAGVSEDPWEDIRKAEKLAKSGIITLKDGAEAKKYVTTDIEEFEDFEERPSPTLPQKEGEDSFDYLEKPL